MTELLDQAIALASTLPAEVQDEIARLMLAFAQKNQPVAELTPEEHAALDRSEAAAARGEFATDERIAAIWAKHGL